MLNYFDIKYLYIKTINNTTVKYHSTAHCGVQYCAKRMQTKFDKIRLLFQLKNCRNFKRNFMSCPLKFLVSCTKIQVLPENLFNQERNFEAISFVPRSEISYSCPKIRNLETKLWKVPRRTGNCVALIPFRFMQEMLLYLVEFRQISFAFFLHSTVIVCHGHYTMALAYSMFDDLSVFFGAVYIQFE